MVLKRFLDEKEDEAVHKFKSWNADESCLHMQVVAHYGVDTV